MHALAVQLAPVLAAEKSKTAFYIAGGVLVAWALTVSLGLGLRRPDFPFSLSGQRIVGTISAVLVLATVSIAVITSGAATSSSSAQSAAQATSSTPATPAPPTTESTPAATTTTATSPKATTKSTKSTPAATKSTPATKTATSPKATTGTPPPPPPPAATTTLQLAANPAGQLAYETKQLTAKAGTVTIQMTNKSPIEHDVAVAQGNSILGQTPVFTGGSKSVTLKLKPGTYKFFCTVPGHRQAGMEGTLTVS